MSRQTHKKEFRESITSLIELHDLIRRGDEDSVGADELRDRISALSESLSPEEYVRLRCLSGDLDSLLEDETCSDVHLIKELEKYGASNLDAFLDVLSKTAGNFPPIVVAKMRAQAWNQLAGSEVSLLFNLKVAEIDPDDSQNEMTILSGLCEIGRFEEAYKRAVQAVVRPTSSALLLIQACNIVQITSGDESEKSPNWSLLVQIYQRALAGLETDNLAFTTGRMAGYLGLAHSLEALEAWDKAEMAYNKAVEVSYSSANAKIARGVFLLDRKFSAALADFKDAVNSGTLNPLPWFFYAYDKFVRLEYELCLKACKQAISLNTYPVVLAQLYAWSAVSAFETDSSRSDILFLMAQARSFGEGFGDVKQNLEALEERLSSGFDSRGEWTTSIPTRSFLDGRYNQANLMAAVP